jgi:hypothetical protein
MPNTHPRSQKLFTKCTSDAPRLEMHVAVRSRRVASDERNRCRPGVNITDGQLEVGKIAMVDRMGGISKKECCPILKSLTIC